MNKEEEWQSTDSGYLNCIGVGDTYVKKQIARILNENVINAQHITLNPQLGVEILIDELDFKSKKIEL